MSDEQPRTRPNPRAVAIVAALAGGLLLFLTVPVLIMISSGTGADGGAGAAPVVAAGNEPLTMKELKDLRPAAVALYRYAHDNQELLSQVPCYCGCQNLYDHQSLARCFVRPDGQWERHASGCFTCTNETNRVRELAKSGVSPSDIRAAVIEQFGPSRTN
jgi:hypothetical protein